MKILENERLSAWTFWKVGGPAEFLCLPENLDDVRSAVRLAKQKNLAITVLGGGTNVLVSDAGVRGIVIAMRGFASVATEEDSGKLRVRVSAGTPKSELVKIFLKWKLAPALFLCGLPGDVGGGIVMNAGVGESIVPREFVEIVDWIEVLRDDEKLVRLEKSQVQWTYRHSAGWQPGIVVAAQLSWPLEPDDEIGKKVKEASKKRIATQPLQQPSGGSTFKNPPGRKAGALIEQAGLKGFQIGGAQVSPKHANFIVNLGVATASDVNRVIGHVRTVVREKFNVELETEVKYLGQWG